jgi:D-alanyl-D-alanine carboxypeptidase
VFNPVRLIVTTAASVLLTVGACSPATDTSDPVPSRSDRSTPSDGTSSASGAPADAIFPDLAGQQLPADLVTSLQQVLDDAVKAGDTPGVTGAVVSAGGTWAGSAGRSFGGGPLEPRAMFAIASITKTFTAAAVLRLAEEGRVDLDAPLSSYVDLPVTDLGPTVRDALGMRSGIPDFFTERVARRQMRRPDRHVATAEMLALIPGEPSRPNVSFDYSNTNYVLLGQLVERVTGEPFAHALAHGLTGPLQLGRRIVVQDLERPPTPVARADVPGSTPFLPNRALATAAGAAGGMAADAESVARWGYLLYGGLVLEPASLRAMLPTTSIGGYGLGTFSSRLTYHGLTAVGSRGDLPGYSTALGVQRDSALSIAVLANDRNVRADLLMDALASLVLEH